MGLLEFFKSTKKPKASAIYTEEGEEEQVKRVNKLRKQLSRGRLDIYERRLEALHRQQEEMRLRAEIQEMEQQLSEFDDEDEDSTSDDGMNPDALMMGLFSSMITKNNSPANTGVTAPSSAAVQEVKISYTDEQIREIKGQIPKAYLKMSKTFTDEQLSDFILKKYPNLDDDTIIRAVGILRE